MEYYAGIDVSSEESSVCVVDVTGKVASKPEALVRYFDELGLPVSRIGLEAGRLSQWLHAGLVAAGRDAGWRLRPGASLQIVRSANHRGFWSEAQRVHEKRICTSLPRSLRMAWNGVKKPRPTIERDGVEPPISGRALGGERVFHCHGRWLPVELRRQQFRPNLALIKFSTS
jgi:hypothetical protein